MKKTFSILIALALVVSFSVVAVPVGVVGGSTATINVSQPVQITSDSHYERGESIVYDGSNYWLFYGRSFSANFPYSGGNPDINDYKVYYKKASTVAGLAAATPVLVPGTHNNNIFNGETTAAYQGGMVRVFAARDEGATFTLYQFYYNGSTWAEGTPVTGMLEGHAAAAECGGDLWLAYQMGSNWTSKYWDGSWHGAYDIIADPYGTAKFYVEGTNLYFVRADAGYQDIFQWNGSTWLSVDSDTEALAYDPTIYKIGSNYVCANAPWDGTRQWIKAEVGTTLSSLLSSPTVTVNITAGGYSTTNAWVDMWPAGFTDNSGYTYLFYTSERNPSGPSTEIAGNIWYLKVDWPVTNDHYTYIQNAVDAASSTTINVAAGTYNEDITITKGLTLTTPSGSPATIDGGIWIKDIHTYTNPITVEYFTIQNGTPITGTRDYGIKISGDIGAGSDQAIVDMHIVNNTFVNVGKTDDVTAEQWWNAAVFYDANHFGALGSRYDTYFTGTGEISHNTIVNNLGDPTKRTQLGIGVRSGLNMRIEHNNISGNVAEGIHLWGPVYTGNTANHQVNHNTIDLSGWIGARIGNNPRGIWTYARDSTYSYNTIVSIWYGMVFSYWDDTNWGGVTAANKPVTVDHNVIHPPTGQSMTAGMRYSGNNGQITDNEIYGATDTSSYGVGLLFEGWGIPSAGERTECKDNTFTGNNIHDNYDGIWTWGAPYNNRSNNVFHSNNIYNNTNSGMTIPSAPTVDAENNWWGDVSGPDDPAGSVEVPPCTANPTTEKNADGTGDKVSDNVDYCPWLLGTASVSTTTGTGTAYFSSSAGAIGNVTAEATPFNPPVALPHGMFSINVTGLTPGQSVTITIVLPGNVTVGTKWWKYQGGVWYSLPIGDDDGDNTITITLQDGVPPGDADGAINGQIIDPGGPGYPIPPTTAYGLMISSTEGGSVTTPGEGAFPYVPGMVISLVASPDAGYKFVNWSGDVDTVADVNDASTTITMCNWHSITANFATEEDPPGEYTLTISSTGGGSVTTPGEGTFSYVDGSVVSLVAQPGTGYEFINWSSTVTTITNVNAAKTTITMNGDYSITANFKETTTGSADGSSGSTSTGACFIATAAYGTPTAEQIDVLREFRDVVLLESTAGSQFVALYYQLSSPVADFIAGNEFLKTIVRELLVDPIVWVVEATGAIWRN